MMKKEKLTKTHAIIILIGLSVAFLYPIIAEGEYYHIDFIKGFLIGSVIGLIIVFRDLMKKETLQDKTKSKLKTDSINDKKKINKEQNQLLFKFLKQWFKISTQEDLQNLIDLNLSSIKGNLILIKNPKSFSLLLFKLLEKEYYTRNQIDSIFDSKKITHLNNKKIDKEIFSKYLSDFQKGKSIDSDKQNENIKILLKSF